MLFSTSTGAKQRAALRSRLDSNKAIRAPGAFSPLVAMEIERAGFKAVYISGADLAADFRLPDIGLSTSSEVF